MSRDRVSPLVIAHRGASGYLPEHTLPAKALAFGQGADFLEQDVVATRDDQLIVLHDIHLDTVTNVASRFPERARDDGRWYARDFDLAEIEALIAHERTSADGQEPVYPDRFPLGQGRFRIPSLADELAMIRGLNRSSRRNVGIYPEIKKPAWHRREGVDVAGLMLELLEQFGYFDGPQPLFLQCFDPQETQRLRAMVGESVKLVQLIADDRWGESDANYSAMLTQEGLADIARYADAIGPWLSQLYRVEGPEGAIVTSGLVEQARAQGLAVHPYTFRADQLAPGFSDFEQQVRFFAENLQVDGLFTDFPDRTLQILGR